MEFLIRIELGFNTKDMSWDGSLRLKKGKIQKVVNSGFDRNPSDKFDSSSFSWKCNIPGRDAEYEKKFQELVRLSGEHGHYFTDAISMHDKHSPSSITIWCDASEDDVLEVKTIAGNAEVLLKNLINKREEIFDLKKDSAKIRVCLIKPDITRSTKTQNLILAIIDGIRYEDSFGENGRKLIPNIWNKLRPLGTIYNDFNCDGFTVTVQAHGSMLTGTWQNQLSNSGEARPNKPTIFEYHKMIETPSNPINHDPTRCILVAGKGRISKMNYSDFEGEPVPEYGGAYMSRYYGFKFGASVYAPSDFERFPSDESRRIAVESVAHSTYSDAATWAITKHVLKKASPSLLVINFGELDEIAHAGVRWIYHDCIQRLDNIIVNLWETIQSLEVYKDKTTLILTTDHGRHDDINGGFQHHGCQCEGCRKCILLAIGPDIRQNYVVKMRHALIDIAPTIGKLLGFATPHSEGLIMDEMLQ